MKETLVTFNNLKISITVNSCLICMKNQGDVSVTRKWLVQPQTLSEMIMNISNITISDPPDDKFPSNVCQICASKIVEVFTFKSTIERANVLFKEVFDNMKADCVSVKNEFDSDQMIVETTLNEKWDDADSETGESKAEEDLFDPQCESESHSESDSDSEEYVRNTKSKSKRSFSRPSRAKRSYKCDFCEMEFKKGLLQDHIKKEHPDAEFQCDECPKSFKTKKSLRSHRIMHSKENFICEICSRMYKTVHQLKTHSLTHGESFTCNICDKTFWNKDLFEDHIKKHKCTICDRSFLKTRDYSKHMRIHTAETVFECPHCDMNFTNKGYYQIHLRNHNQEGFICKICSRKISTAGRLATHCLRVHLEQSIDFACMICDEVLTSRDELQDHLFTHNKRLIHKSTKSGQNNKRHKCGYCDVKLISYVAKVIHEREQHTGAKKPECLICHKSFTSTYILNAHMTRAHDLI